MPRIVRPTAYGTPEVLAVIDVPTPRGAGDGVAVQVRAADSDAAGLLGATLWCARGGGNEYVRRAVEYRARSSVLSWRQTETEPPRMPSSR